MQFKFEEAKKINEKMFLITKIDKILNKINKEFTNNITKQIINSEIIDKNNNLNNYFYNKVKLSKIKTEKTLKFNDDYIEKNSIEKYWYWINNKIINIKFYEKMFKEVENLIDINEDINNLIFLFKEIEIMENKKYSDCFIELFIILNNYKQFNQTNNFNKNWYLKIIFKELFSLIDKIILEQCLYYSSKKINFNLEDIKNNSSLKYLIFNFLPAKIDKWNLIFIEKYNQETKEITLKSKKNFLLKKIEYDEAWIEVNDLRNNLEHKITNSLIDRFPNKGIKDFEQINLEYSIKYLIGLTIYMLHNLNIQ